MFISDTYPRSTIMSCLGSPFVSIVPFSGGSLTEQLSRTPQFAFGLVVDKNVAYAFEECIDFHPWSMAGFVSDGFHGDDKRVCACLDSAFQAPAAFEVVFVRFLIFISRTVSRLFLYYFTFFFLSVRYRTWQSFKDFEARVCYITALVSTIFLNPLPNVSDSYANNGWVELHNGIDLRVCCLLSRLLP